MVKIISDSTCDLSPELIAKYDIDILPLHILLGEDEYEDGKNITPEQIYSWSDENKTTPKTSAPAGGVLKLHPKIVVENGAMNASKKYRGKINSAIMTYVKDMEDDLKAARPDRVFITHSGCDRTIVEEVHSYLENLGVFSEILETRAGGVISSHCGPGTLGVLFIQSM